MKKAMIQRIKQALDNKNVGTRETGSKGNGRNLQKYKCQCVFEYVILGMIWVVQVTGIYRIMDFPGRAENIGGRGNINLRPGEAVLIQVDRIDVVELILLGFKMHHGVADDFSPGGKQN